MSVARKKVCGSSGALPLLATFFQLRLTGICSCWLTLVDTHIFVISNWPSVLHFTSLLLIVGKMNYL